MPPSNFSDSIYTSSVVGTWLGSLFTGIGLLAVITQLRGLIKDFSDGHRKRLMQAAGPWSACFPDLRHSDSGVVEGKAPALTGWIRRYYLDDQDILFSPFERRSAGAQASWSRLFSRCDIQPSDLRLFGGPDAAYAMDRTDAWQRKLVQTDLLIEGGKFSYGFTGDEFAVLLIISGFSPSGFSANGTSSSWGPLGLMHLGDHGPFSQVAQFDGPFGDLESLQGSNGPGRYAHAISVRKCIDLSLGVLRFKVGGTQKTLIPSERFPRPPPEEWARQRRQYVRNNLAYLTRIDSDDSLIQGIEVTSSSNLVDLLPWSRVISENTYRSIDRASLTATMDIAFAIKTLQPWGVPPVLPHRLVAAIRPFLIRLLDSPLQLHNKVLECPTSCDVGIDGWTSPLLGEALASIDCSKAKPFDGLSHKCALYYDAMLFIFRRHGMALESVQIGLAAWCACQYLNNQLSLESDWLGNAQSAIRRCLGDDREVPEMEKWAYEILATYLNAWLQESNEIEDHFRGNFRRRVFLG